MFKSLIKILKRHVLKQFASYDPGDLQKTSRMQDGVKPHMKDQVRPLPDFFKPRMA